MPFGGRQVQFWGIRPQHGRGFFDVSFWARSAFWVVFLRDFLLRVLKYRVRTCSGFIFKNLGLFGPLVIDCSVARRLRFIVCSAARTDWLRGRFPKVGQKIAIITHRLLEQRLCIDKAESMQQIH
jgi:hypothetical protein